MKPVLNLSELFWWRYTFLKFLHLVQLPRLTHSTVRQRQCGGSSGSCLLIRPRCSSSLDRLPALRHIYVSRHPCELDPKASSQIWGRFPRDAMLAIFIELVIQGDPKGLVCLYTESTDRSVILSLGRGLSLGYCCQGNTSYETSGITEFPSKNHKFAGKL